jgi:hypothetical protein
LQKRHGGQETGTDARHNADLLSLDSTAAD